MELTIDQALQQGVAAHKEGRLQEAEKLYRAIIEKQAEHPDANHNLGVLAVGVGQVESALPYFKTALESNPGQGQFWLSYIDALITLDRFDNARDLLQRGKESGLQGEKVDQLEARLGDRVMPSSASNDIAVPAQDEMDRLVSLYSGGNLEEALIQGNTLADQFPHNAVIPNILGAIYFGLDEHETAVVHYGKSIELKPDDPSVHNNLGAALKELGRHEEAITSYHRAIDLNSNDAEPYYNLGTVLSDLGKYEEAIINYNKAIELKPSYAEAYLNLGTEFNKLERYEEAIACFSKAITLNPVFCEAHNNLGLALHQLERFDESISSYKKAIEINVDYDDAYYNLGLVLLAIEDYVEASKFLKKRDDVKSQSYLLRCLYFQRDKHLFCEQLDSIINRNYCNALIGSLCSAASIGFDTRLENPFCSEPLNFVSETDLSCECDFEDIFINPSIAFMDRKGTSYRKQKLLKNGTQTSGNLFLMPDDFVKKIESVIRTEVTKYKLRFGENEEGFMKYWPPDYTVFGWFVKLRRGGALTPHIHENGWLSGSIYINVPKGLKGNDGKLVVCMGEDQQGGGHETQNKRFIDVETGTLCLFPSSLFHYTIPFESEEERLVLAFDIIPK